MSGIITVLPLLKVWFKYSKLSGSVFNNNNNKLFKFIEIVTFLESEKEDHCFYIERIPGLALDCLNLLFYFFTKQYLN